MSDPREPFPPPGPGQPPSGPGQPPSVFGPPPAGLPLPPSLAPPPPAYGSPPAPGYGSPPPGYVPPPPGYAPPPPGYAPPLPPGYAPPLPPGYGPPPDYGPPRLNPIPQAAPAKRSSLPLILAIVLAGTVIGAGGWWLFGRSSGSPTATASPSQVAQLTPTPTGGTPTGSPTPAQATPTPTSSSTEPGATPSPPTSPSPTDSNQPTPVGPTPAGSIDPAIADQIRSVMAQVPAIRGLAQVEDVPFRFIDQQQFDTEFRTQFETANPPERIAAEEAVMKRLGLLAADDDLKADILALYGSQVLAFYDPETKAFTVITRDGFEFGADDQMTVAHEFDHALQDQHYDLIATQVTDPAEGDRAFASQALAEGDATDLMFEWAIANLPPEDWADLLGAGLSPADQALLDGLPPILRRESEFPYIDGFLFVEQLRAQGDWASVDGAWVNPPTTTEQILHPEKYVAGEVPGPITMPDLAAAMGTDWATTSTQTMGELITAVWVADGVQEPAPLPGFPSVGANAEAAAGWNGDRLVSLDGPDGAWALAWQTDWDFASDADEFITAADAAMADLAFPHDTDKSSITGELLAPVVVYIASDQATLDALKAAAGG